MKRTATGPQTGTTRRGLGQALVGLLLLAGAGPRAVAAGLGEARSITVGEAELLRLIEQRFPYRLDFQGLADASATRPRLRLLAAANRLALDVDLLLVERVLGGAYRGRMAFDAGLRFDATDPAIRLTQARVRSFQFDSLPSQLANSVNTLGRQLAEQMLDNQPVYRPRPEDLRSAELLGYRPGAITVVEQGVRLALEPL